MSLLATAPLLGHAVARFVAEEDPTQTHSSIFPETAEIVYGLIAFFALAVVLWKIALPVVKKAMVTRTERIQKELDGAGAALASAKTESEQIRQAKGDIEGERARLLADADAQAEALLADGRARLEEEVAELEAKADADIATLATRSGDELRTDIAELASRATDRLVVETLDDATAQALVEQFIQKVGAAQ
jgi:F-type H+-transporting ATPase subunit b